MSDKRFAVVRICKMRQGFRLKRLLASDQGRVSLYEDKAAAKVRIADEQSRLEWQGYGQVGEPEYKIVRAGSRAFIELVGES